MKRLISILLLMFVLLPAAFAAADQPVLPPSFNGWQKQTQTVKMGADPALVDPADAAVLKEYGFSSAELATYVRGDRKLQVKAARFADASGAFGAYTYYILPQMQKESIPDQGASNNSRVLFYRGNILLDVTLERVTAMSASDLRALSEALPRPHGSTSVLPVLRDYVPQQYEVPNSARYIVGPEALGRLGVPVPAAMIDFSRGAEVEFAKYRTSGVDFNLTLIGYPTPQIATERMKAIQAASLPGGPFFFKRTGSLLAIVSGNVDRNDAESVLGAINYDADVTWNQATRENRRDNIGNLIIGIFMLIGVLLVISFIFGFAFGGVRVLAKRFFPDRVFDRPEDVEIIRLNLK